MIVFGASVDDPEAYERYAEPGIRRVKEPDSIVHAFAAVGPIARGTNLLLDAAATYDDLEALVVVHPRCEITDPDFVAKVRTVLADPDVAVAGAVGATGVTGVAWWDGQVYAGAVSHRYTEFGGGEVPAYGWTRPQPAPAEVDTVDGALMILSPWAVRELRFDEELRLGPGYDVDFCRRARAAGRKVVTAPISAVIHRPLELVHDQDLFVAAHLQFGEKWSPNGATDWKARARRAEAEREAARIQAYFIGMREETRLAALEDELKRMESSPGWKLTAPLRWLNHRRRARAGSRP